VSQPAGTELTAVDFEDTEYQVEQNLIRNKYRAYDSEGAVVLRAKQNMFKLKEEFPFVDADGNDAFTVKAAGMLDVAGSYGVVDETTGEEVVVLDNDFSIFQDTWTIRDASTDEKIAEINSRGAAITLVRKLAPFGEFLPHKYTITDADGTDFGRIEGQFSMKDRYDVTVDPAKTDVPTEPVLASAMVIDAIQGN